ncbi:hypothetical protein KI387_028222, partial [Taxus chinensis]
RMRIIAKLIRKVIGLLNSGSEIVEDLLDDEGIDVTASLHQYKKGGRSFKVTNITDMATRVVVRLEGSKLGATE